MIKDISPSFLHSAHVAEFDLESQSVGPGSVVRYSWKSRWPEPEGKRRPEAHQARTRRSRSATGGME
jgi:hypothetical protein